MFIWLNLFRLVTENHKLQDEISKSKEYRPEEPNEVLKRKVKHLEKEIQGKNQLIAALQEKVVETLRILAFIWNFIMVIFSFSQ